MKYLFGLKYPTRAQLDDDPKALRQGTLLDYNVTKLKLKAPSFSLGSELRYFELISVDPDGID